MKRPTPAEQAKAWKRCEHCDQKSPFLVRLDDGRVEYCQVCVPCYEKAKRAAFTRAAHAVGVLK